MSAQILENEKKMAELHMAHSTTITASNAHKIMGNLDVSGLPSGARKYIESMVLETDENREFSTTSIQWGIENESNAIAAAAEYLGVAIANTGDNQRRFYFGDFVSALPDGVVYDIENAKVDAVVEVKCLDTENHKKALSLRTQGQFKAQEPAKYAQIQVQMLCASCHRGFFVFYDQRHTAQPLHVLQITVDDEWVKSFSGRVHMARNYYHEVLAENRSIQVFAENTSPAPDVKLLPRVNLDIELVKKYHANPEELVKIIQQQAGNFVFDMATSKGRDACRSHAAQIIKCISPALSASKQIAEEAKRIIKADLDFRKPFEAGIRQLAENVRRPLTEWEAEQERLAAWDEALAIEAERQEAARLEAELKAAEYQIAHALALEINELFDLRKEKAEREAKERSEQEAKEQAERERQLQAQAIERERQAEETQKREAARQAEIDRLEREKAAAIEQAKRDAEAAEKAILEAEQQAKAREEAAIAAERQRQAERQERELAEQAAKKAEAQRKAADMEHRQAVNREIVEKMAHLGIDEQQARLVVINAAQGKLGRLVVDY
jgi:hypothetical protein